MTSGRANDADDDDAGAEPDDPAEVEDVIDEDSVDSEDVEDSVDEDADDGDDEEPGGGGGSNRAVTVIRLVLVAILFLGAAGALGYAFAGGTATPSDNSVAAGLARDMTDHHAQAVDMATIIQARTNDAQIRFLATDIALGQTNQMGQMQGWLNEWNLSIGRSGPPMAWMKPKSSGGMDMGSGSTMSAALMQLQPNGLMPGMATQAEVNQLRTLPVKQADVLFLRLMINHHRGGVAMAQVAIAETKERVVVNLCRTIVTDQSAEIVQMTQMLQERT